MLKRTAGLGRGLFVAAVLVAAAASGACELAFSELRANERDAWSRTYTLGADGQVEVRNTNGAIDVSSSTDGKVHVTAEKLARAATAEAAKDLLAKTSIREDVTDRSVRLTTETPPHGFFQGSVNVRYHVEMPAGASLKVVNTNGRITVADLSGSVEAETTNGGVEGRALAGSVRATTTNGGIDVAVSAVHQDGITLETTNGGVTLEVPNASGAELSLQTTNGGIDTGALKVETSQSSRRRLEGRLNGGGPRVRIETTNGGVRVRGR